MSRWRRWLDLATVWFYSTLVALAVAAIRLIRRREDPDGGGTR